MQPICGADLSNEQFPWLTSQETTIGQAPVKLMRLNFVGELGWEIHHPIEYQNHIFDAIFNHGDAYGLKPFGIRAMMSMATEKSYRLIGTEMSVEYSAFESALDRFIPKKKARYVGFEKLMAGRESGLENILVTLEVLNTKDADALGNNPIYCHGELVGRATRGDFGFRIGKSLALAMLKPELAIEGQELEIEILGERFAARVIQESPYDPDNRRLQS